MGEERVTRDRNYYTGHPWDWASFEEPEATAWLTVKEEFGRTPAVAESA
jgi:hypothetical protein